jgi:hypothetical protein
MVIITNDTYPDVSKRNQRIHVARSVAEYAVEFKQATYAPRSNYGSKEWVEERQLADAARGTINGDTNPVQVEESWGVQDKISATSAVRVIRRKGAETFWYDSPPPNCPRSIAEQWKRLHISASPEQHVANELLKEKAQIAAHEQKDRVTGGFNRVIFLGK